MEKSHNDRWAYWVLLIMFIALAIILIRRNKHADYVFENGQITTCQALHKYRLPANQNNGPTYKVIVTFVWGTVKDTLDIQTKQADWETVLPGGIYEMRYLSNERISAQNCVVISINFLMLIRSIWIIFEFGLGILGMKKTVFPA
jgi:hypothetical protein